MYQKECGTLERVLWKETLCSPMFLGFRQLVFVKIILLVIVVFVGLANVLFTLRVPQTTNTKNISVDDKAQYLMGFLVTDEMEPKSDDEAYT